MNAPTLYLAGKITGDPHYRAKFLHAAQQLEDAGYTVINPSMLPADGFTWSAYIRMSSAMLAECETVCFLPDWTESTGAMYEYGMATARDKHIIMFDMWQAAHGKYVADTECSEEGAQ